MSLEARVAEAIRDERDNARSWNPRSDEDMARAVIPVVLAAVTEAIEALYAGPPCEGAYRVGQHWYTGTGPDRAMEIGGPGEGDVLAVVAALGLQPTKEET